MTVSYAVRHIAVSYPDLDPGYIAFRLRYSTYVNMDRGYLYFEVPKAGCSVMKTLIHKLENLPPINPFTNDSRETRRDMVIHDRDQFKMPSLVDLSDEDQERVLMDRQFFRFAVVRNPYARLQSAWKDKVLGCAPGYEHFFTRNSGQPPAPGSLEGIVTFPDFVREIANIDLGTANGHWQPQTTYLFSEAIDYSYVGRLEQFDAALDAFFERTGVADRPLASRKNQTGEASYYDDETAALVYDLYKSDFAVFGYDRDSWRPPAGSEDVPRCVPEARHLEEVRERNIVIGMLYNKIADLQKQLDVRPEISRDVVQNTPFDVLFNQYISGVEGSLGYDAAELLFDAARGVGAGCIIALGAHRGRATIALALGAVAGSGAQLFAIDPHREFVGPDGGGSGRADRGRFMRNMLKFKLHHRVALVNVSSEALVADWFAPVALLWLDGDRHDAAVRDFRHWRPRLTPDAVVIFAAAVRADGGPGPVVQQLLDQGELSLVRVVGKVVALRRNGIGGPRQEGSDDGDARPGQA